MKPGKSQHARKNTTDAHFEKTYILELSDKDFTEKASEKYW